MSGPHCPGILRGHGEGAASGGGSEGESAPFCLPECWWVPSPSPCTGLGARPTPTPWSVPALGAHILLCCKGLGQWLSSQRLHLACGSCCLLFHLPVSPTDVAGAGLEDRSLKGTLVIPCLPHSSLLKVHLQLHGFSAFIDVEKLEAGKFEDKLIQSVMSARNFVLVLSPGSLDKCMADPECKDWVHKVRWVLPRPFPRVAPWE